MKMPNSFIIDVFPNFSTLITAIIVAEIEFFLSLSPLILLRNRGIMSHSEKYTIHFGSLTPGIHEFLFEINDAFFQQFENSIVQRAQGDVLVTLDKKSDMLILDFTINGQIVIPCDRCLEELSVEITGNNELLVKFGENPVEESEDVIVISNKSYQLDVSQFIYEYFSMLIPLRNVHPDDENGKSQCNPEALKAIEKYKLKEEQKATDPRWEGLKGINPN